jgi:Methyltransferase domain
MNYKDVPLSAVAGVPQGQISEIECKMLYWFASELWSGHGAIVELGSLFGKSTVCLARGMAANAMPAAGKVGRLHAFDRWEADDENAYMMTQLKKGYRGSFRSKFDANTKDVSDWIVPHEGDIFDAEWTGGPIEILFIDCSVSKEFHEMAYKKFFPHLSRGSVVIHQDYFFYRSYYLPLMMGKLAPYITEKGNADTSMIYQVERPLPECMFEQPLASSDEEIVFALETLVEAYGGPETQHGGVIASMLVYFYKVKGDEAKSMQWAESIVEKNAYYKDNPVHRNLSKAMVAA